MSSPLYDAMGGGRMTGQMGQMQQMIEEFNRYKASFKGDAREEVQKLLNTGKMTQEQYNQLQQMANQLSMMLGR